MPASSRLLATRSAPCLVRVKTIARVSAGSANSSTSMSRLRGASTWTTFCSTRSTVVAAGATETSAGSCSSSPASLRMSGGMVAEKNRFCRFRGSSRTMRRIGLMKPRSSIWSTSSRTKNSTAPKLADARVEMIEQTSRRRHQHVEAARQRADLRAVRHAAEDDGDVERQTGREIAKALRDLAGEFARRAEHQDARPALRRGAFVGDEAVEDRQREGGGLAGAGLGDADEIAPFHQDGNGLRLNRRRLGVAHFGQCVDERRGEAEAVEIFQVVVFQTAAKAQEIPRCGDYSLKGTPRVSGRSSGLRTGARQEDKFILHAAGAHRSLIERQPTYR